MVEVVTKLRDEESKQNYKKMNEVEEEVENDR